MKLFRVLLVFVFMFATVSASTTARAQAAGGQQVGFIRLLSKVDPTSPIQFQARRAYQHIRPQLLALQAKGEITTFEPEFRVGIVKVQYVAQAPGMAAISGLAGFQTFDNIHDAIVSSAPVNPPSAQAEAGPVFQMQLYSGCFSAANLGADSHIIGSLKDKKGRIVASYDGLATSGGYLDDCFPYLGMYNDVTPGFTVTFKVYDTTPLLIGTFSTVVPDIKFTAINNTTAAARGTGPASKDYALYWFHKSWDQANNHLTATRLGKTSSTGAWSKDMGSMKFRGGDNLDIYVTQNASFQFMTYMEVPYIYCQLGDSYCELSGFAFTPATLSITHGGVKYSFSGKFDEDGYFDASLGTGHDPIFIAGGDKISGTSVSQYTLPTLTTTVNFTTNVVHGNAPANKYFDLVAYQLCGCVAGGFYAHSTAAGTYSYDFTSQVDLVKGEAFFVNIYYVDPVTGNEVDYYRSYGP